jgi:hypothetical protein
MTHISRSAQKLGQGEQLLAQNARRGLSSISNRIGTHCLQLLLVSLLQSGLLALQTRLVLDSKLLVVADLLLNLGNRCLERRLLQGLSLLVGIDLLLGNKVVQGFAFVLGDDGIDLGSRVLYKEK